MWIALQSPSVIFTHRSVYLAGLVYHACIQSALGMCLTYVYRSRAVLLGNALWLLSPYLVNEPAVKALPVSSAVEYSIDKGG